MRGVQRSRKHFLFQGFNLMRRDIFRTLGVDAQLFVPRVHFQKRATTKLKWLMIRRDILFGSAPVLKE
jgi:hypothetical protein